MQVFRNHVARENPIFFRERKMEDVGEGEDIGGRERVGLNVRGREIERGCNREREERKRGEVKVEEGGER